MSYLVLARKWRPQTFSDLIGQEHVSRTLQNAIDSGRIAHAFLFTGARGVGKTSSARILAKALNCEQGTSTEPCNSCSACLEITNGNSVDVSEIDGASNNSVDDIRDLRENVKYLPSRSRYKIFIIDEVHMLSASAFNALLKTLEEPPPHVKFIFATTEPHKVPITILSRCQRFDFKRIPLQKLVTRLRYIVDQEGVAITDKSLAMVARKGDGSMRDALSTLDQVLAFCDRNVSDEDVAGLLGAVDRQLLQETSAAVLGRDARSVLDIVGRVDAYGYNMRQFCQELIEHFRNLAIIKAVDDPADILDLSEPELAELRAQTAGFELQEMQRYLTILLRADGDMAHATFPRLIMEMALLKMTSLRPVIPVAELMERLKAIEAGTASGVVATPPPVWGGVSEKPRQPAPVPQPKEVRQPPREASPAAAPAPPAQPEPAGSCDDAWSGFVAFVRGRKPLLASLLEHGRPMKVADGVMEIGFQTGSFQLSRFQNGDSLAELKGLAELFAGKPMAVRIVRVDDGAGNVPPTLVEKKSLEETTRRNQLMDEVTGYPMVSAALEIFGGEIESVKEIAGEKEPAEEQ